MVAVLQLMLVSPANGDDSHMLTEECHAMKQ
jgi:hypothetical protein